MSITLDDLRLRLEQTESSHTWIDPSAVAGYDRAKEFRAAKDAWLGVANRPDLSETAVELIPDYLDACLLEGELQERMVVNGEEFLDAVIWLVVCLGSSYAVGTLCVWRELVSTVAPQLAFDRVLSAAEGADEAFVRDIIRNMTLEFFDVGERWPGWQRRFEGRVSQGTLEALERLLAKGYETIDNSDARRFSDGAPRFRE